MSHTPQDIAAAIEECAAICDRLQVEGNFTPAQCATMIRAIRRPAPVDGVAGQPGEPVARFCPGCGSIGEVPDTYRDCCPDGSDARVIPLKLAEKCRDTFKLAIQHLATPAAPAKDSGAGVTDEPDDNDILQMVYEIFEAFHSRRGNKRDARSAKRPMTQGSLIDGLGMVFDHFEQYEDFWLHWKDAPGVRQHAAAATAQSADAKPDLHGIDAGPISEWVYLVRRGAVSKDEILIMAKDAAKAMTPLAARAAMDGGKHG